MFNSQIIYIKLETMYTINHLLSFFLTIHCTFIHIEWKNESVWFVVNGVRVVNRWWCWWWGRGGGGGGGGGGSRGAGSGGSGGGGAIKKKFFQVFGEFFSLLQVHSMTCIFNHY